MNTTEIYMVCYHTAIDFIRDHLY